MLRFARRLGKWLGWLLLGSFVLVLLIAFAIQLPPVRGLIRDQLLAAVRGSIKGEIELDDVRWPSLEHLELSGLTVRDQQGKRALSLATLTLNLNTTSLLAGQLDVRSVVVSNLFVDMAELDQSSGLLSLFASDEPAPPPKPPSAAMSPIAIAIREVCIEHGEVRVRPASEQAFKLDQLDGCVRLHVAKGLYVATNVLQARISRNEQVLAVLRAGAELPQLAEETPVDTLLTSLDAKFALRGGEMSFDAWFKARGFSPATLRALDVQTDLLQRSLNLDLHVRQVASVLGYRAEISSRAGRIDARGELDKQRLLSAHLLSSALRPDAISSMQLPKLGFAIDAQASLADPKQTELRVNLTRGYFDHWALPLVNLHAVQQQDGTSVLQSLRVSYGDAAVSGSGRLAPSGALEAQLKLAVPDLAVLPPLAAANAGLRGDVRAQLAVKRDAGESWDVQLGLTSSALGANAAQAKDIKLDTHVSGILARPVLTLGLRAGEVAAGGQVFSHVEIGFDGGPQRYQFRASADEQKLRALGWLQPDFGANAWDANLDLHAELPKGGLHVRVPKLRLVPGESLQLTDLVAEFSNAKLRADGRVAFQGSDSKLRLSAEVPDMSKLLSALGQPEQPGRLTLKGLLQGELQRPTADLELRYVNGPQFNGEASRLALQLHTKAARGRSSLTLNAAAGAARIDSQLESKWSRSLPLSAALTAAQHELKLSVREASLAALLDPQSPLPSRLVDGLVQADISARGNQDKLELAAELRSGLHMSRDRRSVDAKVKLDYRDEQAKLALDVGDRRGQLWKLQAATGLPLERQLKQPVPARELIDALAWELSSELSERPLGELPYLAGQELDPELAAVRVRMHTQLGHAPHAEPTGTSESELRWEPKRVVRKENASCLDSTGGRALLAAKWAEKKLGVELSGGTRSNETLQVSARAHVPFAELLDGGLKDFAGIQLAAKIRELNLQELPWACRHGRGQISVDSEARDLLTPRAKVTAQIATKALRWDDSPDLNLELNANTAEKALLVTGDMQAGGGRTHISGRLPVDVHASQPDAMLRRRDPVELDLKLSHMPMATLLALVPAVARVSGTTSGQMRLRGSVEKPALGGELALEDVSLTIPRLGQRFSHLQVKASLEGSTLRLSEGRVKDLDGSASIAALIQLESFDAWRAELNLNARNFPLRKSGVIMGRADLNAKVKAETTREHTKVGVELSDVAIILNGEDAGNVQSLEPHPEFSYVDQGAGLQELAKTAAKEPAAAPVERPPTEIRVVSKDGVWVRRDDFAVEMQTDITVTIASAGPRLQGEIKLLRGYISLFGQSFDIKRGRVVLAGGETVDPQLEITAQHDTPGGSRVRVEVTGFARAPQLTFYVDDKAVTARDALIAITGGGGRGNAGKGTPEQQIAAAAVGMTTGLLTLGARREFGDWVPMLAIEQGDNTRVRVGVEADKFIPKFLEGFVRGAYVEGIVSTQSNSAGRGAQTSGSGTAMSASGTGVLLELMLPSHFVWAGQYGPGQAWSIDLDWRP